MATSGDRNGGASRQAKGMCDNGQTITRQAIKARVLGGLMDKLFAPELVAEFVHAFQEGANATGGRPRQVARHHHCRLSEGSDRPAQAEQPRYRRWAGWMKKYYPEGDAADAFNVYGYSVAATLVQVVKQCGDDLTRENVMKQAAHLDFDAPMLLPGVKVRTRPTNFFPIREMQLARFDGTSW
jgi:hypothetical protein